MAIHPQYTQWRSFITPNTLKHQIHPQYTQTPDSPPNTLKHQIHPQYTQWRSFIEMRN